MSNQELASTVFEGLFKNVVLRPFLRMVGSLFGQSSNQSSGVIDAMDCISISSSSSDDSILREIDNYRESPLRDTGTSSASLVPQPLPVYGGQSDNAGALHSHNARDGNNSSVYHSDNANSGLTVQGSSYKRFTSNGGSSNVMSGPVTQSQALASSSGNQGTLHLQTAQANSSDDYNNDDFFGRQFSKRAKTTLPTSLQTSMPSSGRKTYVDRSSSHSNVNHDYGRGRAIQVDMGTSSNKGNRALPPSLAHGRSANPHANVSGPSRMLPPSLALGRSAYSNGNMSGPSHPMGDDEEDFRGTDERILFQAALKDLSGNTGEIDVPEGVLSVPLLAHQRIALAWMMEKEKGGVCVGGILADDQGLGKTISMIALIQMQRSSQDKYKSAEVSTVRPEALNLDDDDDDVTVASTPAEVKPNVELGHKEEIPKASSSKEKVSHMKPLAGTLVVCPASVLRQWVRELDEKVTDESKLSVLMYHGSHRTKDPVELAKYDVVLTTYSIVSIEVPKQPLVDDEDNDNNLEDKYGLSSEFSFNKKLKKTPGNKNGRKGKKGTYSDVSDGGALAKVRWFRIILDEAQTIKNHRTQVARACCSLRAKRRWCLSGTPIQNSIDELFSYFRFLRHDPFSNYKKFIIGIKVAISRDSNRGYKRLQLVLKAIMLRRTKGTRLNGKPIITLPPKTIHLTKVEFSPEERAFYSKLEADSKTQFKAYAAAGTVNQNYANILLLLLRLRQACDHPLLVKGFNSDAVGSESSKIANSLSTKKLQSLIRQLETTLAICGICQDPPENAVVTICGHVFCFQCVSDYLTGEDTTCPEPGCKEHVSADVIFTKGTLKNCLSDEFTNDPSSSSRRDEPSKALNKCSSSKIKAAVKILETYCKPSSPGSDLNELATWNGDSSSGYGCSGSQKYKPTKAIVFTQWTGMLDLVENSLTGTGIKYRRLDGTMSLAARDKGVKDFNTRPEVTVMLMSLKAGNLGLNMVAACHVILLDLWWNPTTEDQAIDRAHRIGQTRAVTVTRLTVKDTVEDRILALQEEKRKMVASAFGEDPSGGSAGRLTMEDLWNLFDVRRSDI